MYKYFQESPIFKYFYFKLFLLYSNLQNNKNHHLLKNTINIWTF